MDWVFVENIAHVYDADKSDPEKWNRTLKRSLPFTELHRVGIESFVGQGITIEDAVRDALDDAKTAWTRWNTAGHQPPKDLKDEVWWTGLRWLAILSVVEDTIFAAEEEAADHVETYVEYGDYVAGTEIEAYEDARWIVRVELDRFLAYQKAIS